MVKPPTPGLEPLIDPGVHIPIPDPLGEAQSRNSGIGACSPKLIARADYRALMRNQAAAVTIVAAGRLGKRAGMTATSVCSLSDDPPTVLACIGCNSLAHDVIAAANCFSVNILSHDQTAVADLYAGRHGVSGEARFEKLRWHELVTGAPVLKNALASLDCDLVECHRAQTHSIFIGHVRSGVLRQDAHPLLYFRGGYRELGD